jgi:hypothetical protein
MRIKKEISYEIFNFVFRRKKMKKNVFWMVIVGLVLVSGLFVGCPTKDDDNEIVDTYDGKIELKYQGRYVERIPDGTPIRETVSYVLSKNKIERKEKDNTTNVETTLANDSFHARTEGSILYAMIPDNRWPGINSTGTDLHEREFGHFEDENTFVRLYKEGSVTYGRAIYYDRVQ